MNAPTSAVGRAAVQMCAARGVPVVCALRARETDDAWERDARYLKSLGASLVVRDAAGGFRTRAAANALGEMPPVALALLIFLNQNFQKLRYLLMERIAIQRL